MRTTEYEMTRGTFFAMLFSVVIGSAMVGGCVAYAWLTTPAIALIETDDYRCLIYNYSDGFACQFKSEPKPTKAQEEAARAAAASKAAAEAFPKPLDPHGQTPPPPMPKDDHR